MEKSELLIKSPLTMDEAKELQGYKAAFDRHGSMTLEDPIVSHEKLGIDYNRYRTLMERSGVKVIIVNPERDFFEN